MSTKRTIINADEELVIKGKLTIEGNVTQIETTQQVTNLEGNVFTINSDGSNTSAVLALNSNGTVASFTFDSANGSIVVNRPLNFGSQNITTAGNITGAYIFGNGSGLTGLTTSIVTEGTRLYFTSARARGNISVTDNGGDGSLSYDSGTGVITYTGPSASEVRAHLSATDGVEYSNTTGVINVDSTVVRTSGDQTIAGDKKFNDRLILASSYPSNNSVGLSIYSGNSNEANIDFGNVFNTPSARIQLTDYALTVSSPTYPSLGTEFIVDSSISQTQINTANTFINGTTYVTGNIEPTAANTYNLGSWANHFNYVFANVLHAEYLDLEDANISDIHNSFYVGLASSPSITRSGFGLTFTHNTTGAYYQVNAGDGLQISGANVAVDSTVVRTTGDQTITGNIGINGTLTVAGTINSQNVEDTYVKDTKITLNSNAAVDNTVSIEVFRPVAGANTYIKWDESTDQWKFTNNGSTEFLLPTSTTDLAEGANLYYTPARANSAMDAYLVGGAGLTYTSGTFAVGAGDGINVNADNVTVDASVVRTSGNQTITGIKSFTGELVIPAGTPTSNNSIYVNAGNTAVFAYVGGQHVQLTADSDVGQVEDVGSTGTDIYAGFRTVTIGNNNVVYHGIRSIDGGTYTTASVASNVITIDGNISAIRGSLSTANVSGYGGISYSSANGVFSYFGVTDAQIRGLFSASGLLSYNASIGAFTTSADNYGSWTVQTDSGAGAAESITSGEKLTIQSGTGISVTNTGNVITITNSNTADITGVSAGDGLTGGGNSGDVTLNIGAGNGITVNADNVAVAAGDGISVSSNVSVDSTVVRTTGVQTIAGSKTLSNTLILQSINTQKQAEIYGRVDMFRSTAGDAANGDVLHLIDNTNDADACDLTFRKGRGTNTDPNAGDAVGRIVFRTAGGSAAEMAAIGVTAESGTVANVRIFVNSGNVGLEVKGDKTVKISNAYSLPTIDGSSGQKLTTYGNGTVYWSTESADITEVIAGNGLTDGGSSGAVTLNIGAGAGITVNPDNVALTSGIITTGAKTYGTASQVPVITVDTYGRVTSVSNTSISITASQVSDFTSAANTAIDNRIVGGSGLTYSSGTLAVGAGSYITVAADAVSVDATTTNTASKVVARDGSGNVYANYFVGTATAAQYADLAENYLADGDYLPGTVLVFGGNAEVTASISYESTRVAGVVTTQPAHVMNSHLTGDNVACIALRGRVPVKVKGVVRKGDVLVSAGEGHIGYAVAALDPRSVPAAAIIGKAISDKLDAGPGVVEALI